MNRIRQTLVLVPFLVVGLATTATASPEGSSHRSPSVDPSLAGLHLDALGRAIERAAPYRGPLVSPKHHGCAFHDIQCGQTINSDLNTSACELSDGSFVDFYLFDGIAGDTVTIDLSSTAFDTFLALLDPTPEVVATDDDGGPGTDSRIVHVLDQTSSDWTIAANAFFPGATGPYTLSLACQGQQPPDDEGFFSDPAYPDFLFRVKIENPQGDIITGVREPSCISETVCVSGALPGRSELFIRIIGPRPNGFLWPTLVRFTPSRVEVDIRQLSTQTTKGYVLPIVPPGTDELSGLQDRTGFLP